MNWIPEIGMYVRFKKPLRINNTKDEFVYLYGQISSISKNSNQIRLELHDLTSLGYYEKMYGCTFDVDIKDVERVPARLDAKILYDDSNVRIVPSSSVNRDAQHLYEYQIEYYKDGQYISELVNESLLSIHMTCGKLSPLEQLINYEYSDPFWYLGRTLISEAQSTVRNSPDGFKSILGSVANLFPHQLDTIVRALSETPCRFMLADEVGLGKTIEACSILKGLLSRNRKLRTLIIVPAPLIPQWISELNTRFRIKAKTVSKNTMATALQQPGVFISSYKTLNESFVKLTHKDVSWDLCIIDEAHKLLHKENAYDKVLAICQQTENVLVLSATPVLKDGAEYRALLSLLEPDRFKHMSNAVFTSLVTKQADIRDSVFNMMQDLPDYVSYNLSGDYIDRLKKIQDSVNDSALARIIQNIESEPNPEKSIDFVKIALAHISEHYRIDNKIIRHRKSEILEEEVSRDLKEISYDPAGMAEGFFELECLQSVSELFSDVLARDPNQIGQCKKLLQATTSSPYAVLGIITNKPASGYALLDRYLSMIDNWKNAFDWELKNISELKQSPDRFHSKLAKILLWIDEEDPLKEKKFLIFSEYPHTAQKFYQAFSSYYGENTAKIFVRGMEGRELSKATTEFQNTAECRFMICDASGGVGRNFQMADYIVHCDLSWSPAIMEQRIGRLDRIGRDPEKRVISVVIHSEYGIEMDLFRIYNEGLNVFNKSLCGMEIAFDEIQKAIDTAFVNDPEHGLQYILPEISEYTRQIEAEVEQERFFDQARQLDLPTTQLLEKLVDSFTLSNSTPLASALCKWARSVGINKIKEKKSFYDQVDTVVMDLDDLNAARLMKYTYALPFKPTYETIFGTFSRAAAVSHEKLYFMAPSNALYDSIAKNAEARPEGMAACIHISNADLAWEGFTFCWNIHYDYSKIIESGFPSDTLATLKKFLSAGQVRIFVSMPELVADNSADVYNVFRDSLLSENSDNVNCISLDQLNTASAYMMDFDWDLCVRKAYQEAHLAATEHYKDMINVQNAKEYLEERFTSLNAKSTSYSSADVLNKYTDSEYVDLFLYGIENPIFELDSAAYLIIG